MSQKPTDKPVPVQSDFNEHDAGHPFCWDMSCPCHTDQEAIEELNQHVQNGLATTDDANRIYRGKTV